jgi:hypothetical protein
LKRSMAALVFGNSAYQECNALNNPMNDAQLAAHGEPVWSKFEYSTGAVVPANGSIVPINTSRPGLPVPGYILRLEVLHAMAGSVVMLLVKWCPDLADLSSYLRVPYLSDPAVHGTNVVLVCVASALDPSGVPHKIRRGVECRVPESLPSPNLAAFYTQLVSFRLPRPRSPIARHPRLSDESPDGIRFRVGRTSPVDPSMPISPSTTPAPNPLSGPNPPKPLWPNSNAALYDLFDSVH